VRRTDDQRRHSRFHSAGSGTARTDRGLIGGSAGIGLETARRARVEGAEVILTGSNPDRLEHAARDVGARSTAAFDATDATARSSGSSTGYPTGSTT
jgi:threonine dehydrogenase-like Zn-dependent dehydrogenase